MCNSFRRTIIVTLLTSAGRYQFKIMYDLRFRRHVRVYTTRRRERLPTILFMSVETIEAGAQTLTAYVGGVASTAAALPRCGLHVGGSDAPGARRRKERLASGEIREISWCRTFQSVRQTNQFSTHDRFECASSLVVYRPEDLPTTSACVAKDVCTAHG